VKILAKLKVIFYILRYLNPKFYFPYLKQNILQLKIQKKVLKIWKLHFYNLLLSKIEDLFGIKTDCVLIFE
jgi:hypothetical protein